MSESSEIGVREASETGEATPVEIDSARNREVNEKACITRGEGKTLGKTGRRGKMNPAFKGFGGRRHEANSICAVGIFG